MTGARRGRRATDFTRRIGSVAFALVAIGCTGRARPTCSASDPDCGTGWECVDRESLEACVAVVIPYPCTQTHQVCLAQGILTAGEECLGDGECADGLYCPYSTDGRARVCTVPECETSADCPDGQACRLRECRADTLDSLCGEGLDCARHQYCAARCVMAPAEGGNACESDDECAAGQGCVERTDVAGSYCSECATDADCAGHESGPHCYDAFCAICSPASCPGQVCNRFRGCVECNEDADCPTHYACSQYVCRERCDFPNHEECASGQCDVGGLCVLPVGTACASPDDHSATECGDGSCVARDASGGAAAPYCTRWCDSSTPPCPAGYTCVESVEIDGITDDVCLAE